MRAFKENPVFFSLTALLLLCSVVFSILSLLAFGKKNPVTVMILINLNVT